MGVYTAELRDEIVPITANNFINLTNAGFYDGLHFHRVVHDFVIQDGDPLGTGYGGPGYTIPDEFSPLLNHNQAGTLAMAHTSLPNSAGSQYYITLVPTPQLNGNYAVFGQVIEGLDVVLAIGSVEVDASNHPLTPVYIDSLRILDLVINNISPAADTVDWDASEPYAFSVEAFNPDLSNQYAWYIDDLVVPNANDFLFEPTFASDGTHILKCVCSDTQLFWTHIWTVHVTGTANDDDTSPPSNRLECMACPNPFYRVTSLQVKGMAGKTAKLSIYDSRGRCVLRKLVSGTAAGMGNLQWDGRSDQGYKLPTGIYYIKVSDPRQKATGKVLLLN